MELYVPPDEPVPDPESALVDGLAALSRVLVGFTARTLAGLDAELTLPQYRTLVLLAARGPLRTVDLATALEVHPSTATRTCDRLVRRGLVARRQGTTDRRVAWLTPTEAGRDLVAQVVHGRTDRIRDLVRRADGVRRATAADLVNALVEAAGEPTESRWWRDWAAQREDRTGPPGQPRATPPSTAGR
ncbi:MarR family transcriptional regulator [Micromonospora sp. WMMD980]|uniref:MarR family winged helix-turn-helix transcriptional regulator n=1 Tax=Micromonospora sp. WMMD980 TaxID=3016088 RepID=UPI002416DDB7|nr:MarR family transcriptional regulator [Micromonospora sp. WMMD980]MDG4801449.1 MarR family transcriptional regulator [Micromonospora sp. WMMD980]